MLVCLLGYKFCMVLFKHGFVFAFVLDPQYLKRKMAKYGNALNSDKIGRYIAENMGATGECIILYFGLYCFVAILVHIIYTVYQLIFTISLDSFNPLIINKNSNC